jgi:ParB-like chromosome segregation protein Spo0J
MQEQDKHNQLGDFGGIPGAPSGPPDAKQAAAAATQASEGAAQIGAQKAALSYACAEHIHEAANLFPPMSDAEFAALRESIRVDGQTDPIWTWQGKVIDGRHRLRACNELNIEPKMCEWDGKGSLIAFVVARNLTRRHLDESQRAMVAARLKPAFEQDARQRVMAGKELDPQTNLSGGQTRAQAGEVLNVSGTSVTNACRVLKLGIPELISAVDRAEIAVSKAALIAQFTKEQQAKILALSPQEADKATKALIFERKQAAVAAATGKPPFDARAWGDQRLLETFKCLGARLTRPYLPARADPQLAGRTLQSRRAAREFCTLNSKRRPDRDQG